VTRGVSAFVWLALVGGCRVESGAPPKPAASSGAEQGSYPGRCALVGVQMLETPTDRASVDSGSVQVVATYRPGAGAAPLDLSFLVRRERVNDLRAHLEQHPSVLCAPRSQEGDDHAYDVQVPPFEGQSGKPKSAAAP
jgi:hypothetical protein